MTLLLQESHAVKTETSIMTKYKLLSILFALFTVLFFSVFSLTLTIMASVYIAGDLGGSNDIAIYTVCFYGLGNVLGIPLGYPLSYRYGTVSTLCISLHLFAFFSLLCMLAPNYPFFLLFRLLQGIAAGPFFATTNLLFASLTPQKWKSTCNVISSTMLTIVPILGACWGGWIAYDYHWRYSFFFNIVLVVLISLFIRYSLNNYELPIPPKLLDKIGFFFYLIGVFCLFFVFITGQELDWFRSPLLVLLMVVGSVCLLFFFLWSRYHPFPLFAFALFKKPLFSFGIINLAILFSTYFGTVILLSLWLNIYVNYNPIFVALLLSIMGVVGLVPAILLHKRLALIDPRILLGIAMFCLIFSSFYSTVFNQFVDFERIAISRVIAGFGLVFFLIPLSRLCFHSFSEEKAIAVMELFQAIRISATTLGASIYATLWQRFDVFYHDRYGSSLTVFSEQTEEFFVKATTFGLRGLPAADTLNDYLNRQSRAFALNDCFFLMGWVLVGLFVLLLTTLFWKKEHFIPENKNF